MNWMILRLQIYQSFSANVFERDIRMSMESGMNAHLTKPIDIPLLLKTFTEILQGEKG